MKIAVLSGKGGAGKTFVAVNLAAVAGRAVYVDCDVEEPNGRLFFKPEKVSSHPVCTTIPVFDADKCIGCRKCVDFCRFNALVFLRKKPKVFPEVCHACGGCQLVCPTGAVTEQQRPIGTVEQGRHGDVRVVTGILNLGEASGIPVINDALKTGLAQDELTVIDCPPGSACSVMESVTKADYCVLVAEPTAFGFHNFQMVYELVSLLGKRCGVVVNKMDMPYPPLEEFCQQRQIPILERIPYSAETAALGAAGHIAAEETEDFQALFAGMLDKIGGAAR